MRSIKEIFVIGHGPSSSHTMGPAKACDYILKKYKSIKKVDVTLFGSLALTGKGHLTDYIIKLKLKDYKCRVLFDKKTITKHPNTMLFVITDNLNKKHKEKIVSIGGGTILTKDKENKSQNIYPHKNLTEIVKYCKTFGYSLEEYVLYHEGEEIISYLSKIYDTMMDAAERGINTDGYLPGKLHVRRRAKEMYLNMLKDPGGSVNVNMHVAIAAIAVSEENAAGGIISIGPTCGSAGVIPGAIKYLHHRNLNKNRIVRALMVAGLIGIISKTNASISGAEAGCQAEIGVACSMAAAMIASALDLSIDCIAQSAEIALEHSLGLTCDPVYGYVQIPCIERCAMFALKAVNAVTLARLVPSEINKVSFDNSLKTMYQTGKDLQTGYRETSNKGLAKTLKNITE